jgi:vitamin B12 transporter
MESQTDASGINLEYDLRLIPAEQVESIEIMKGAASTLRFRCSRSYQYHSKLQEIPMNIGTQTTADRTNIVPKTTTKGFLLMEI